MAIGMLDHSARLAAACRSRADDASVAMQRAYALRCKTRSPAGDRRAADWETAPRGRTDVLASGSQDRPPSRTHGWATGRPAHSSWALRIWGATDPAKAASRRCAAGTRRRAGRVLAATGSWSPLWTSGVLVLPS